MRLKEIFFKKLSAIALLTVISTISVFAGSLQITPEKPKQGERILIQWQPEKIVGAQDPFRAFVYTFTEMRSVPKGEEVIMEYDAAKKGFKGYYTLEKDVVFGLVKVGNKIEIDNNKENFWDFMVYNESGNPVRGAQMRAGISYLGNLPEQAKRMVNMVRALELIEKESAAFPTSQQAQIGALSLKFENKQIEKAVFDEQLGKIVNAPFDKTRENDLRAVTRALKMLTQNDRAALLETEFAAQNPRSELSEEVVLAKLSAAQGELDFTTNAKTFVDNFPSSVYTERIFAALLNAYLQNGRIIEAKNVFNQVKTRPASGYNMIAHTLATNDTTLEEALTWSDKALSQANMPNIETKPIFVTASEWEAASKQTLGALYFTRGAILNKLDRSAEALDAFQRSLLHLGDNAPVELYGAMITVLEDQKKNQESYDIASEAIRISKSNDEILARHKALYAILNPSTNDSYEKVLGGYSGDATTARRSRVKTEKMMMPLPAPNEIMTTFDGKAIKLADLKGKIVILDFWATWCGPCKQSFPALQKLYEKYKSNSNVVFAIVNVWERDKDRKGVVKAYLDKNPNFTFPMYFDETDAIVKAFGVTGIPTKFYLDKNGIVQFKEVGFAGETGFLRDAEDKIEVLLKEM